MTTPYTLEYSEPEGVWLAHSLAFDLIGSGENKEGAIDSLHTCLTAQCAFGLRHGRKMRDIYFVAPPRYWKEPFHFMEMPNEQEMGEMKFTEVV